MTKAKLFAWDFHGTLEQGTEVGFAVILRKLAQEINYQTIIELEEVRRLFGVSILDYLKHFFPKLSNTEILELRNQIRDRQNRKHIEKYIKAAPWAHEVLAKIQKAGHKNIIVSTSSQPHIKRFLRVVKVTKYFDGVFGIDRHSLDGEFDIAALKAKAIKSFAQNHEIDSSQVIVIGDRPGDIDAGLLLNATTYQYVSKFFPDVKTNAKYKITDLRKVLREI